MYLLDIYSMIMKRQAKTPFTILGMLSIQPATGYEIKKQVMQSTSNIWSESLGQIYPALALLLKQGKITEVKANNPSKRTCKKYKITPKGLASLKEWLQDKTSSLIHRDELLLKLFFGKNISVDDCIAHVMIRKNEAEKNLKYCKEMHQHIITEHADLPAATYWLITLNSGIHVCKAALEWCNETIQELDSLKKKRKKAGQICKF